MRTLTRLIRTLALFTSLPALAQQAEPVTPPAVQAAPVATPVAEPVTPPAVQAAPVATPVAEPVSPPAVQAAPVATPVAVPVSPPAVQAAPVAAPVAVPVSPPAVQAAPVAAPVAVPVNPYLQQMVPAIPPAVQAAPVATPVAVSVNPYLQMVPALPMPTMLPFFPDMRGLNIPLIGTLAPAPKKPYTMRPAIPPEIKRQMMQMMMPIMNNMFRMSMPDAMNWMAHKIKVKPGVSFDDVVQSMNLRANQLNFKHVGENLMYKDFQAVLEDKDAPRIEVHSYCDIAVGRELLKISPEFVVFLPCRVVVMEDGDKQIWVLMLDWNMDWVAGYSQQMGITPELAKGAMELRDKMENIMRAGANGDI